MTVVFVMAERRRTTPGRRPIAGEMAESPRGGRINEQGAVVVCAARVDADAMGVEPRRMPIMTTRARDGTAPLSVSVCARLVVGGRVCALCCSLALAALFSMSMLRKFVRRLRRPSPAARLRPVKSLHFLPNGPL